MNKRIWKLYKELRRLRRQRKILANIIANNNSMLAQRIEDNRKDRQFIQYLQNELMQKRKEEASYSTLTFTLPNLFSLEREMTSPTVLDRRPRAEYMTRKLTDDMKIKMFNDLLEQGYINYSSTYEGDIYTIKVVR